MLHKRLRHQWFVRVLSVLVIFQLIGSSMELSWLNWTDQGKVEAAGYDITETKKILPSATYKTERLDEGYLEENVNIMQVHVGNPNTTIQMNYPKPFPSLGTVTSQAKNVSKEGNRVVGSINGSFYHTTNAMPAYLISENQSLFNLGAISAGSDEYMSVPTAFGMTNDGKAMIGKYNLDMRFLHDGGVISVDSLNRSRGAGEIILYTSSYHLDWTKTNEYGIEITVENADKSLDSDNIKFGDLITGEITDIREYGEEGRTKIPDDGFVLSIQGGQLAEQFKYTEVGEDITLRVDIDDKWKDTKFMMASGPMLVNNGEVDLTIDKDSYRADTRHPRTAVGTNKDGSKVYFITVDGRQNGFSDGMTLSEFANYIESKGIYDAINLDGGGSTTMAARQPGDMYPTVLNSPSGGTQRAVSTTLHAVSTAPTGAPAILEAHRREDGKVVKGSTTRVAVDYLLDQYYNPLNIDQSKLEYSVEGNVGRMEGETFFAENEGSGQIVISYGDAEKKLPIEVVETVDRLEITPGDANLGTGVEQQFDAQAFSNDNSKLIFNESTIEWKTEGDIGEIDQNGLLTAADTSAEGSVIADLNGYEYKTSISVGGERDVIDEFTSNNAWYLDTIRARGLDRISKAFEPVASGDTSMHLEYNFATGETGTAATYIVRENPIEIDGRPDHLGMWVYGDGKDHWLRGKIQDGNGDTYSISFTENGELNWNGWKYVKADIPNEAKLPLKVSKLYVAEPSEDNKDWGTLHLDRLSASYKDEEESLHNLVDHAFVNNNKEWTITFSTELMNSSINNESIYVQDVSGNKVDANVSLDSSKTKVTVTPAGDGYTGNKFYQLVVTTKVKSSGGANMRQEVTKVFQVK
ncbi:phosphodiester glycosidase family protein [Pontibacillus marinus]|uniref:Phosphodiester glycosidase domain-containing protein n=1 Tax=Pontibacillus marinus BH030004 = DSM 16465 TaxID=1385511 RepID=A0A0A5G1Y9_9BACI|nr:phosphodiester glycosidase family protein [Pontibacillus marinus]KGX85158.1 hypothetical protein N783_11415 [Pontibacillus marinus BH030004 = DSM 16465]